MEPLTEQYNARNICFEEVGLKFHSVVEEVVKKDLVTLMQDPVSWLNWHGTLAW